MNQLPQTNLTLPIDEMCNLTQLIDDMIWLYNLPRTEHPGQIQNSHDLKSHITEHIHTEIHHITDPILNGHVTHPIVGVCQTTQRIVTEGVGNVCVGLSSVDHSLTFWQPSVVVLTLLGVLLVIMAARRTTRGKR